MQLNYKTAFLQLCKDIYIMHVYVKMFEGVFKCMYECGCLSQRARAFQRQYISKGIHSLSLSVRTSVRPSVRPSFKSYVYSLCQSVTNHSFCHTFIHLTIHPSCQTCNQPNIYPLNPYHYYHTLSHTHTHTHVYLGHATKRTNQTIRSFSFGYSFFHLFIHLCFFSSKTFDFLPLNSAQLHLITLTHIPLFTHVYTKEFTLTHFDADKVRLEFLNMFEQ